MKVLITGANRGLGLSLVETGLKRGHVIFAGVRSVADRDITQLQELKKVYEGQLRILHIDVTNEKSVIEAAKAVKFTDQYVDIIINNAAILNERDKTIEELDIAETLKALDTNTVGPIRVIKHFLPLIRNGATTDSTSSQSIINISSEAGSLTNAYAGDYPYGLSKVALNMLTEKLKKYLMEEDIQVLSIHPGWMSTDMGGKKAPKKPMDTALNIWNLLENPMHNSSEAFAFFDDELNRMEI